MILQSSLAEIPLVPTSALKVFSATTAAEALDVSIESDSAASPLYSGTLAAFGGKVELLDPASIIEEWMREKNMVAATITVTFGNEAIMFDAIYCEYELPDNFDFSKSFLSLIYAQRTHKGSVITIAAESSEALMAATVTAVGLDASGTPVSPQLSFFPSGQIPAVHSNSSFVDSLLTRFRSSTQIVDIQYLVFDSGSRQKVFFIVDDQQFVTIGFRNIFNIVEYIDIPGIVTEKSEISRDSAMVNNSLVQYNQQSLHTYEISTAPLTRDEAEAFAQIVGSRETVIRIENVDYPIKITDHTIESTTDDTSLDSMKFTFRFPAARPCLFMPGLSPFRPSHRIFTEQYSKQYK